MTSARRDWGLDNDVGAYIERVEGLFGAGPTDADIDEQRRRYVDMCRAFAGPPPPGLDIRDGVVDGRDGPVPIRIFRSAGEGAQACLVYVHGGGWVLGDLDSHHGECAEIAAAAGVTVIAVAYRLDPEHPYPAAHEDSWDVLAAVSRDAATYGVDARRIAVGGDSAGANIAAGLALRARDRGGPVLAAQFLIYAALGGSPTLYSYAVFADAPLLTTADMKQYAQYYCGSETFPNDPFLAPLRAGDLSGLPPTFLQPAGIDPLRDDSIVYAERLRDAGVDAELAVEDGLPHGFLRARHSTIRGRAAFRRLCYAVRKRLA